MLNTSAATAATGVVNATESLVQQLNERVRELECRVAALEVQPEKPSPVQPPPLRVAVQPTRPPETWQGFPSPEIPAIVTVLGKAVLGFSGAYLLRAIAESGVAKLPMLIVAIAYASFWMVWAIRHHSDRFASFTYASTSVLILCPLLWESTVRFRFLPPLVTGMILVGFFVMTMAQACRRGLQVIPWVASLVTVTTALALILATHEMVPLTAALLAVALAAEVFFCSGYQLSMRVVPAIAADIAVWLLIYLMTSREGVPEGFHATGSNTLIAVWLSLIAIYVTSTAIRAYILRQGITVIDIGQGIMVFLLGLFGAVRASQPLVVPALGVLFLVLAQGCYWGMLSRFAEHSHNRRIFGAWGAALLVVGSMLLFPAELRVSFLCIAAVVFTVAYTHTARVSLGVHAALFLAAAAAVSPLPVFGVSALAGTVPDAPDFAVWIITGSAALCYALGSRMPDVKLEHRILEIVPAVLVGFAGAALAVTFIVWIGAGRFDLSASRISVIRTVVTCAAALAFGSLGFRWRRIELGWVAYAAVAFGTLKLLFEDLRFGNAGSLVVSLLFYGTILILLPRLSRRGAGGGVRSAG